MAHKEQPLPKPPNKAFGRKTNFEEQEEQGSLLADRMAQAAAEGKLDEFLRKEMPDNEYARNLAGMMMGMTGMMPMSAMSAPVHDQPEAEKQEQSAEETSSTAEIPDDVRQAIMGGDIQSLMGLLRREHQKRNPDSPLVKTEENTESQPAPSSPSSLGEQPAIDKEIIDTLVQIANDNNVTLDWIMFRAIKLYVQEYKKSGRL